MNTKTIFLDRDGVINIEKNYLYKIDDFEFIDGIFNSCKYLISLGYEIIIITNQSGIAREYYSEKDFQNLTDWMLSQFNNNGIKILNIFYCPHSPNSNCNCRKPKPGMLIEAKNMHNIDMEKSWMIGDSERDILAATRAGINNTVIVRSGHKVNYLKSSAKFLLDSISQISQVILA